MDATSPSLGKGVLYALLSFFCLAFMSTLAKAASTYTSAAVITFFQNAISLVIILPFVLEQGVSSLKTRRTGMLLFRAITGAGAWYCLFFALRTLPVTNAVSVAFSAPL